MASCSRNNESEFVETDAIGETNRRDVISSASSSAPKSSIQNFKKFKLVKKYEGFEKFMPLHLKNDNIDILIIRAKKDEDSALILKQDLEQKYRVEILDIGVMDPEKLEEFFKRAMFFFLFVTEEFRLCYETHYHAHTFLSESLQDENKRLSVFPVYPYSENDREYLTMSLRHLPPLKYYNKSKFWPLIETIFYDWADKIVNKDRQLHEDRNAYFDENEPDLLDKCKFVNFNKQQHWQVNEENAETALCDTLKKQKIDDFGVNIPNHIVIPATMKRPVNKHQINCGAKINVDGDTETDGIPTYPSRSKSKVMKGKLKAEDERRIQLNFIYLKEEIDGKHIVNHLYQRNVISSDDKEEIDCQVTRSQRTEKLLTMLLNAGPGAAYQVFYDALKEQYPQAAEILNNTPLQDFNEARLC